LISILLVWVLTGILVVEAVERTNKQLFGVKNPQDVDGMLMTIIAIIGIVINVILAYVLFQLCYLYLNGKGEVMVIVMEA